MKKTKLYLLFSAVAMVLLTAGTSYAWFARQQASMDTLLSILPPDTIVIIPVSEGGNPMTELDLDYREGDSIVTDEDGNKTIRIQRPVCVKSSYPAHRLEVVRTTNLSNLTFNIYLAPWNGTSFSLPEPAYRTNLLGRYLNLAAGYDDGDNTPKLAKAEKTLNNNYQDEESVLVEEHAYPLYWLANKPCKAESKIDPADQDKFVSVSPEIRKNEDDPHTGEKKDFYYTYYYLEISWKETTKQTDLFYILAHNVAQ